MPEHQITPLAFSLASAAKASSLSETSLDKAISAGDLPVRRYGNRTLILAKDLSKWLESLPSGRPSAPAHLEGRRSGRPRKFTNTTGDSK